MKTLLLLLMAVAVCAPVFGVFDHTISNTYEGGILALNNESLLVTGAGANEIDAKGSSYVEVRNTAPLQQHVGGIYALDLDDDSTLNYYDGEMGGFYIYDNAEATFSGGSIVGIASYQYTHGKKHITFICDVDSVNLSGNLLTGDWLDGSSFSIILHDQSGYGLVYSNIEFVPEPATLALFALGGLFIRRMK